MKFVSTQGLVAVSAFLVASLSAPCSGAPLRGIGGNLVNQQGDGPLEAEEDGLALLDYQSDKHHLNRGLYKKGGMTAADRGMAHGRKLNTKSGSKGCKKAFKKGGSSEGEDCTIMDLLMARKEDFSIFIEAVDRIGLLKDGVFLDSLDFEFTVFAPTNEAFLNNPALFKYFDTAAWKRKHIFDLIFFLILEDEVVPSEDFVDGEVLLPATGAIVPSDAFVNLRPGKPPVLTGPFIPSPGINIIEVDHFASNGVLHVLDGVATVLSFTPQVDLIGGASVDPNFTKMLQLLTKANLVPWLRTPGPIHVFAIPDPVFDGIQGALVAAGLVTGGSTFDFFEELCMDPNLREIMENHIIVGKLPCHASFDCSNRLGPREFTSVAGNPIVITEGEDDVNGLNIIRDEFVNNGTIDIIQGVLFLPGGRPDWLPEAFATFLASQGLISFGPPPHVSI